MCLNLWNCTQVQLDGLDGQVLSKTLNVLSVLLNLEITRKLWKQWTLKC